MKINGIRIPLIILCVTLISILSGLNGYINYHSNHDNDEEVWLYVGKGCPVRNTVEIIYGKYFTSLPFPYIGYDMELFPGGKTTQISLGEVKWEPIGNGKVKQFYESKQ